MPHFVVTGASGVGQPASGKLVWEINAGWSASLEYPRNPPVGLPATQKVTIELDDGDGGTLTSPSLYLRGRSQTEDNEEGRSGSYQLLDETSVDLSSGTKNYDTFINSSSTAMGAAIAASSGKSINGVLAYPVWKEDIKQSTDWEPLRRLAAVAGQQLVVTQTGAVLFVDNAWDTGPSPFKAKRVTHNYNPQDIFGRLYVSKNVGQGTNSGDQWYGFTEEGFVPSVTMDAPLFVSDVQDHSAQGAGTWVTFYNAADEQCYQHRNGGSDDVSSSPNTGPGPAVKFSIYVEPDDVSELTSVRIRVVGAPAVSIPAGIDPAISKFYGSGRGWPREFSESLIPSEAWADAHWQDWLQEINRGKNQLVASADHFNLSVAMGQEYSRFGLTGRTERIEWSFGSGNSYSTTINAEVLS